MLTAEEEAQGLTIGEAVLDQIDGPPADMYRFVWIADKVFPSGVKLGLQGVIWPMRLSRQGNVAGGIVPAGTMWGTSGREH